MIKKEIIEVTVDSIKFKIQEYNWKKSLRIQKMIGEILSPVLNVLALNSDKTEENQDKSILDSIVIKDLGSSIKTCLLSIPDLFGFFKEVFSDTFVIKINLSGESGEVCLNDDNALEETFHKKTMTAFKLVFEVMKVNELGFTNGGGGLGSIIGIFKNMMTKSNVNMTK